MNNKTLSTWLRVESTFIFALTLLIYHNAEYSWTLFLMLFLVPDVSMLGYVVNKKVGALFYNMAHSYIGPAIILFLVSIKVLPNSYDILLIWASHIAFDRMLGFGLKSRASFFETHLGHIKSFSKLK